MASAPAEPSLWKQNRLLSRCKELAPGRAERRARGRGARSRRSQAGLAAGDRGSGSRGRDLGGSGQEDAGRDLARHDSTEEGGKVREGLGMERGVE